MGTTGTVAAPPETTGPLRAWHAFVGSGSFTGTQHAADGSLWTPPPGFKAWAIVITRGTDATTAADPGTAPDRVNVTINGVQRSYLRGQALGYGDESSQLATTISVQCVGSSAAIITWETS